MALAPLSAGHLIGGGRYRVRRWLGSGSFGEVYEVDDLHQHQVVAFKYLRRVPAPGAAWDEARVLTHLNDPYILPIRNADFDLGVPYIVTELATHGTAGGSVGPPGVPPHIAVRWTRCVCRATARTHSAGLLHRDIKPDNIFLTGSEEAVLGDFGLAVLHDAAGHGPPGGTATTMAPEVALGGPTSVLSDVYSLGTTLYALLAGRYAHVNPAHEVPPPIRDVAPHVTQALAQRLQKAIARNSADRYATASEFDAALGTLPAHGRYWVRTDEHVPAGHAACWRGSESGRADVTVCAIPHGSRWEVVAVRQPSGRRILDACRAASPMSRLPRNLRAAIGAAS